MRKPIAMWTSVGTPFSLVTQVEQYMHITIATLTSVGTPLLLVTQPEMVEGSMHVLEVTLISVVTPLSSITQSVENTQMVRVEESMHQTTVT